MLHSNPIMSLILVKNDLTFITNNKFKCFRASTEIAAIKFSVLEISKSLDTKVILGEGNGPV